MPQTKIKPYGKDCSKHKENESVEVEMIINGMLPETSVENIVCLKVIKFRS